MSIDDIFGEKEDDESDEISTRRALQIFQINSSDYRNKTLDDGSNVHDTIMLQPTNINDVETKTKNINI